MRRPVGDDFAVVNTTGKLVQAQTIAAELGFEYGQIETSQIFYCLYSEFGQLLSRNLADSGQTSNRQWQKKGIYVLGLNHKEAIRFAPVRGQFCQELVGRHTGRSSQIQFMLDLLTDRPRHQRGRR